MTAAERRKEARQRQRDRQDAVEDFRKLREATKWASEPTLRGIRREVRLVKFPDQPRRPGLSVQVQYVDLAESLFWFELELHPEIWPGAATMPVHDPSAEETGYA